MKILHIVENLDNSYGGPAKSIPLLVKYLNKLNIENKIFTIQVYENEENNILCENNIDVIKVPLKGIKKIKFSPILEAKITKEITDETIIHVHTLWTYPTYLGYKIAKKSNIPLIVSLRGMMYDWCLNQSKYIKKIAMCLFQKKMLKKANIIHITESNEKKALENIGIYNNTVLIPNGVELNNKPDVLNQEILNKINYKENKKYIMFLGRIVHNKGLHYLLNSYTHLKKKYPNIEILVVGGIEDKKYFRGLEQTIGVHFLGILDGIDKYTIFSISSLFVLPSYTENFGISIAEAMSYKIPVITTQGTPWKELEEKNAGWWVKLSQENIDKAIDEALNCSDDELREKGNKGFEIIKSYTWDKQALKMKETYKNLLNKRRI